jgi:hypothetical protein
MAEHVKEPILRKSRMPKNPENWPESNEVEIKGNQVFAPAPVETLGEFPQLALLLFQYLNIYQLIRISK